MNGFRFSDYKPDPNESVFDRLFKLFQELMLYSSGNVAQALSWLNDLDRQYSIETVLGEPLVRSPLDPAGASFQYLPAPTGLVTPRSPLRTSNATFTFSPAQWAQHLQNLKKFEVDYYKNPENYKDAKGHMIF